MLSQLEREAPNVEVVGCAGLLSVIMMDESDGYAGAGHSALAVVVLQSGLG